MKRSPDKLSSFKDTIGLTCVVNIKRGRVGRRGGDYIKDSCNKEPHIA